MHTQIHTWWKKEWFWVYRERVIEQLKITKQTIYCIYRKWIRSFFRYFYSVACCILNVQTNVVCIFVLHRIVSHHTEKVCVTIKSFGGREVGWENKLSMWTKKQKKTEVTTLRRLTDTQTHTKKLQQHKKDVHDKIEKK